MQVLQRFRRSELLKTCDLLIGALFCALLAVLVCLVVPFDAQRAIATLHSFRFFGLVFILPGVVGPNLPRSFAAFAAYWDLATGVLAMLALVTTSTNATIIAVRRAV